MEKSLKKYKRLILIVSVLLISAILCGTLFACSDRNTADISDTPYEHYDTIAENGQVVAFSKTMAFTTASLFEAQRGGQDGIHVTLVATVYPENAENQNVSWNIRWADDAPLKSTPVSEYLVGSADSSNSHRFNATCKQAFLNNKILITVTTEEGGFSATCTVSFIGLAESLNVTSSTATLTSTAKRGQYYAMNKDTSYTFNIGASNSWGVVGATDYEVILGGHGQVYFAKMNAGDMEAYWWDERLVNISDYIQDFASASINGNTLTITMGKKYVEEHQGPMHYIDVDDPAEYHPDTFYAKADFDWETFEKTYDAKALENFERLESVYFTATVRDKLSGSSVTIPFFFRVSVEGVYLNNTTENVN